ncbi:MAG: zinc ribbon domain-containing protein [Peptococcaceae bacterium]|nr:zinc ribbon domain-containing protein [Peptococcaceae bacterium]
MATYKQPCLHCGEFIERDARLCPKCHSRSPFGYHCPFCMRDIQKGQAVCDRCGRSLYVVCPTCGQQTFAGEWCETCGAGKHNIPILVIMMPFGSSTPRIAN